MSTSRRLHRNPRADSTAFKIDQPSRSGTDLHMRKQDGLRHCRQQQEESSENLENLDGTRGTDGPNSANETKEMTENEYD